MRIGEECVFLQLPYHGDPYPADLRPICNSITLTSEAAEILSLIVEQLSGFPSPLRGALLLSGDLGVDKSHLLHYLECMLSNPEYPLWSSLLECLGLSGEFRPKGPIRSLFLQIPKDLSRDLAAFLTDSFQQYISPGSLLFPDKRITTDEFSTRLHQFAVRLTKSSLGMVVLENVTERMRQSRDSEKLQGELRLYRVLSEILSREGILTIFVGKGTLLNLQEQAASLLAGEEEVDRSYFWIETAKSSNFVLPPSVPKRDEEFHRQLQLWIYDWVQAEIPSWRPVRSPRYQRDSQALAAAIPEGEMTTAGMVYFKSVFDPYWSDEDLARVEKAQYPWILMILNPCERFYEFETRLNEIASRLAMLRIWRPGTPSKTELENLRSLALEASGSLAEMDPPEDKAFEKIRPIMANLYITRGRLIGASEHCAIGDTIKSQALCKFLSACLSRLLYKQVGSSTPGASFQREGVHENQALHWAALLAGCAELRDSSAAIAQQRLIEWWDNSAEELSRKSPDFPEAFRTIRFYSEIKYVQGPLLTLKPVFHSLRSGAFALNEAMDHVARSFAWDSDRLMKWKQGLEGLVGLTRWLPIFLHARDYLSAAFPLDREDLDHQRESLIRHVSEAHRFLEAKARNEFDEKFSEFKQSYADYYCILHEDALHTLSSLRKDELKVDPAALRNLDLLSGLHYTDKSYLNRVKLLAKWMQHNQCNLPVRQILEQYPRCYCSFNPCGNQQPVGSVPQIGSIIQDGIDYFRTILRRCGYLIMEELKNQRIEDSVLSEITAALSDGAMIPLKPQSIKILNGIIGKYPNEFLAVIRKAGKQGRPIH